MSKSPESSEFEIGLPNSIRVGHLTLNSYLIILLLLSCVGIYYYLTDSDEEGPCQSNYVSQFSGEDPLSRMRTYLVQNYLYIINI